jgi:hypothetical protein
MNRLDKLLIHLRLRNNNHVFQNLDGKEVKNSKENVLKREDYNCSYHGDLYAYDWYNSEFEDPNWRKRWIG